MVHVSTVDTLGVGRPDRLADEEQQYGPKTPTSYSISKKEAELAVVEEIAAGLSASIVASSLYDRTLGLEAIRGPDAVGGCLSIYPCSSAGRPHSPRMCGMWRTGCSPPPHPPAPASTTYSAGTRSATSTIGKLCVRTFPALRRLATGWAH